MVCSKLALFWFTSELLPPSAPQAPLQFHRSRPLPPDYTKALKPCPYQHMYLKNMSFQIVVPFICGLSLPGPGQHDLKGLRPATGTCSQVDQGWLEMLDGRYNRQKAAIKNRMMVWKPVIGSSLTVICSLSLGRLDGQPEDASL